MRLTRPRAALLVSLVAALLVLPPTEATVHAPVAVAAIGAVLFTFLLGDRLFTRRAGGLRRETAGLALGPFVALTGRVCAAALVATLAAVAARALAAEPLLQLALGLTAGALVYLALIGRVAGSSRSDPNRHVSVVRLAQRVTWSSAPSVSTMTAPSLSVR